MLTLVPPGVGVSRAIFSGTDWPTLKLVWVEKPAMSSS